MEVVGDRVSKSPQVELWLRWSLSLLQHHGDACTPGTSGGVGARLPSALRTIHKGIVNHADPLSKLYAPPLCCVVFSALFTVCLCGCGGFAYCVRCEENTYTLKFLASVPVAEEDATEST